MRKEEDQHMEPTNYIPKILTSRTWFYSTNTFMEILAKDLAPAIKQVGLGSSLVVFTRLEREEKLKQNERKPKSKEPIFHSQCL
jgi:hypothetical protein